MSLKDKIWAKRFLTVNHHVLKKNKMKWLD